MRIIQLHLVLHGQRLQLTVASFPRNNVLVNNVRVKDAPARQLPVGDTVPFHLMVQNREIVGGIKRDHRNPVKE